MQSSRWAWVNNGHKIAVIGTAATVLALIVTVIAYAFPRGPADRAHSDAGASTQSLRPS